MNTQAVEENKTNGTPESYLAQFIGGDTKIIIDTCSMLDPGFPLFVEHVIPLLEKNGKRIVVPLEVTKELVHHLDNPEKPELRTPAIMALRIVNRYKDSWFCILGEKNDSFPDNLFLDLYIRYRQKYHMLFITQDKRLAADILNNNDSGSVRANAAVVKRITPEGYLSNVQVTKINGKWVVPERKRASDAGVRTKDSDRPFPVCTQPADMPDTVLPLTDIPGESDAVYAMDPKTQQFAEVVLKERIAAGGEGAVYGTNTKFAAKIYKEGKVTARRREKIMRMINKGLEYPGISFPVIPLFNGRNEFIGYLMKQGTGEELRTSVFCPIPVFRQKHPDWKREDLVRLCIAILNKIEYLHSRNIIIGDINPGNILVKSSTEVFFVDTDSYQIGNLPCPVGQCNYTAPEIQGKAFDSFLRTMGNENFAIATLLFQILLPGKLPYAHAGGGNQSENIREMNFPYRLGENGNRQEPGGQWKYMWSHLPYAVKEAFYNTFQKGGTHSAEETRLSAAEWKKIMESYLWLLKNGKLAENDPMSESIFPTRPKAGKNALWTVCRHCGEKFPYYERKSGQKSTPPLYCPTCREKVAKWCVCGDCGGEFPVSVPEYDFYLSKKFSLPRRCPACRKKEAEKREENARKNRYGGLEFNRNVPGQTASVVRPGPVPGTQPTPGTWPTTIPRPSQPVPRTQQMPRPQPVPRPRPVPGTQPAPVPQPAPGPRTIPTEEKEKRSLLDRFSKWLLGA